MRRALVRNHGRRVGILEEDSGKYRFTYDLSYVESPMGAISLTLPKGALSYTSDALFPFFAGLLSEGTTRDLQHRMLRIDDADAFGLLVATGGDAVGSVTVEPLP